MPDRWIVLFPIEDLDIEAGGLSVADVSFSRLTSGHMSQWQCFERLKKAGLKEFCDEFRNHTCAEVEVEEKDKDTSYEKASSKVRSVLDLLRIFKGKCELREPRGAVMKNKKTGKEEFSWFKAKWTQKSAWPWKCKIKRGERAKLTNLTSDLEPFLEDPDSCELNRRIIRSLRWSADATQEIDDADRIIKCVTALECLLLKERKNKRNLLAERIAVIWTSNNVNRDKIFSDIKGFYELRNCIVHGEKYDITRKDLKTLDWLSRLLVSTVADIAMKNSFTKVEDVIKYVSQQKSGWKPPKVAERPC